MQREVGQFAKPRVGKAPMAAPVRRSLALFLVLAALLAVSITADGRSDRTVYAAPQAQTLTTFTTAGSHSYTIPSGVLRIRFTVVGAEGGGGGGGGGSTSQGSGDGVGGSGGAAGSPGATGGSSGTTPTNQRGRRRRRRRRRRRFQCIRRGFHYHISGW